MQVVSHKNIFVVIKQNFKPSWRLTTMIIKKIDCSTMFSLPKSVFDSNGLIIFILMFCVRLQFSLIVLQVELGNSLYKMFEKFSLYLCISFFLLIIINKIKFGKGYVADKKLCLNINFLKNKEFYKLKQSLFVLKCVHVL